MLSCGRCCFKGAIAALIAVTAGVCVGEWADGGKAGGGIGPELRIWRLRDRSTTLILVPASAYAQGRLVLANSKAVIDAVREGTRC